MLPDVVGTRRVSLSGQGPNSSFNARIPQHLFGSGLKEGRRAPWHRRVGTQVRACRRSSEALLEVFFP